MDKYKIKIDGKITEIQTLDVNKQCMEITRLITCSSYWNNKQYSELMKICINGLNKKKLLYAHETEGNYKKINMFYTKNNLYSKGTNISIFITGVSCMINDKEVSPSEAYKILCSWGICNFKKNNIFNVKRIGKRFDSKPYEYIIEN